METSHQPPRLGNPSYTPDTLVNYTHKRQHSEDDCPPAKKPKPAVEEPQMYSEAVRKKLASTSRTGQACDRCKERKMKCDIDPIACGPCRQKGLRCYTTDRVTGQSRERGQYDRAESELQVLRDQNAAYQRKYGPLQPGDFHLTIPTPVAENNGDGIQRLSQLSVDRERRELGGTNLIPTSQYVGWPSSEHDEPLYHGPVNGTVIDILDGSIDIADFECEMMQDSNQMNVFNVSSTSIMNTITGHQTITDPRLPPKEEALRDVNSFFQIVSQYVPVVHRPSFLNMVHKIYDRPTEVTLAEQVQLVVALAMVAFLAAVRNHQQAAEKFEQSHHWIHFGLTWYRDLFRARNLASMQALALILVHFRNLPKPGYTWTFGHSLLVKAMELEYHRDPDKIVLPPDESDVLSKELRKRVFHSILGICVTTGSRVSKPAPWQFQHMDVPLPMKIVDSEISENGVARTLSGRCDYWSCIHLAKLLPLLTELYNYVTSVRHPEVDYLRNVEVLHGKIDAWRRDWDDSTRHEDNTAALRVATLFVELWAAEFVLNLYHPSLCASRSPETMEKHLDICHRQAQRLLKNFHILSSRYKGVDFTWHSTAAYIMGFGATLHVYRQRRGRLSPEQFDAMKNELKGWMSLVAYADLVMRTGNHLQHLFEPRVRKLEDEYRDLLTATPIDPKSQYQTPTSSVSGTPNKASIKSEPSNYHSSLFAPSQTPELGSGTQQSGQTPVGMSPAGATPTWAAPIHYVQSGSNQPAFSTYSTLPGHYQAVPTSLAPLLNGAPNGYVNYPPVTSTQNDMMMFAPNHYTDGAMAWPMITLSPEDQFYDGTKG